MKVSRGLQVLLLSAGVFLGLLAEVGAGDVWTTPHPGIRRLHRTTSNQNINVLLVDLCKAGVSLRATATGERRRTVSSFGNLVGAHAAINGDFFSFSTYSTDGMSMSGGALWSGTKDHGYVAPLAIGAKRIEMPHHNNVNAAEPWMKEIVSGHPTLLDQGTYVGNSGDPLCTARHPRTIIGLTQDKKTLILAVVDGRATSRIGMTCPELATLLREFGAYNGVNMDGGGSSSMWVRGVGVVNNPSDGSERTVANHLAVFARGSGGADQCPCQPGCQGSKITGPDCGVGDCAAFGATCADDRLGVRCVSVFCPALGTKKVCLNDKLLGDCKDGAITTADCSAFGLYCSTAGVPDARCVSVFCVASPTEVPKAKDICLPDGRRAHCDNNGGLAEKLCPAGHTCVSDPAGAFCKDPSLPAEPKSEPKSEPRAEPKSEPRPEIPSEASEGRPETAFESSQERLPPEERIGPAEAQAERAEPTGLDGSLEPLPETPGPSERSNPRPDAKASDVAGPTKDYQTGRPIGAGCSCQIMGFFDHGLGWLLCVLVLLAVLAPPRKTNIF